MPRIQPWVGHKYALILGRCSYDSKTLGLGPLVGVAPTVRNVAVDLHRNGFMVVVVADKPMTLPRPSFDNQAMEQTYVDDAIQATQAGNLVWSSPDVTRVNVRAGFDKLAAMVAGHRPSTHDQLIIYIAAHGIENASDSSYGAALGEIKATTDADGNLTGVYEGAYTMEQLHHDLGVKTEQRWRNTLVVLDTCHSGAAFDTAQQQRICTRTRGVGDTDDFQRSHLSVSFHCLAAAASSSNAFCDDSGTVLHKALRRVWMSLNGAAGAFERACGVGVAEWATVQCVADYVNVELADLMASGSSDFYLHRQTCLLGRLPWLIDANVGEFIAFNKDYIHSERRKLAMVPPLPFCFMAREAHLAELHSRLMSDGQAAIGNSIAISATGGVGKSALAIVYATEHVDDFTWLLWVRGTNAGTMVASFREAAAYIPLSEVTRESNDDEVVAAMRQWLGFQNRWLMVVDGWDRVTKEMLEMMPAGQMGGKMIVTTRLQDLSEFGALFGTGSVSRALLLDVLKEEEALEYLLVRLPLRKKKEDMEALREVAVQLGGMPLALELAGGYLAEMTYKSVSEYQEVLKKDRLGMLQKRTCDSDVPLVAPVLATYRPSIEQAMEIGGEEMVKKIVAVMGIVEGSGIDVNLLHLLATGRKREVARLEDEFDVALLYLCRFSILKINETRVSVHELVQDVCRAMAFVDESGMWEAMVSMAEIMRLEINDIETVYRNREWSQHVGLHGMKCVKVMLRSNNKSDSGGWNHKWEHNVIAFMVSLAWMWRDVGYYDEALYAAEAANSCVPEHETLLAATAFCALGGVHIVKANYDEALRLLEKARIAQEAALNISEFPLDMAHTYRRLGDALAANRDYPAAEKYYSKALKLYEDPLLDAHSFIAHTLSSLGNVFEERKKFKLALERYNQAFQICTERLFPEHPLLGETINRLASIYYKQRKFDRALKKYQDALVIKEASLGEDHPSIAATCHNIGLVYRKLKKNSQAEEFFKRADKIYNKKLGDKHPLSKDTAETLTAVVDSNRNKSTSILIETTSQDGSQAVVSRSLRSLRYVKAKAKSLCFMLWKLILKLLLCILCIVFFPISLYAFYRSLQNTHRPMLGTTHRPMLGTHCPEIERIELDILCGIECSCGRNRCQFNRNPCQCYPNPCQCYCNRCQCNRNPCQCYPNPCQGYCNPFFHDESDV